MNSTFNPDPTPGGGGAAIELTCTFVLAFIGLIIVLWLILPVMEEEIRTDYREWRRRNAK